MGGRDLNNVELTNPFEYDPSSNSWTTKSAIYPDAYTNNMACGVLNDSGTDYIYCVGGSNFATQTASGRVFRYDPITDTISSVSSNFRLATRAFCPVASLCSTTRSSFWVGSIFLMGGIDQIWQFTPSPAGWVQKSATLPVPLGYLPTTTIGSLIYTGGGADITGGVLTDTTNSFVYDPVADSINTIADITEATSNTRAVNFCNQMYVLGGDFNAPSNEVHIYDPASNTWSLGVPFPTAGRNFAADTDGTNNIWKAGGYDIGLAIIASMEIFNCPHELMRAIKDFHRCDDVQLNVVAACFPDVIGAIGIGCEVAPRNRERNTQRPCIAGWIVDMHLICGCGEILHPRHTSGYRSSPPGCYLWRRVCRQSC